MIKLNLMSITFPNNKIQKNWFDCQQYLHTLVIIDNKTNEIEPHSFESDLFQKLVNLTLINLPITNLPNKIFSGLMTLKTLVLKNLNLKTIDQGIFDDTPKIIAINIIGSMDEETSINHLFKSSSAPNTISGINYIENSLGDRITNKTFGDLSNLYNCFLRNNKITWIAEDAFDKMGKNLVHLDLSINLLTTIPERLLMPLVQTGYAQRKRVWLEENPWDCNCDLVWLQLIVKNYPSSGFVLCASPPHLRNKLLENSKICDDVDEAVNTTTISISISTAIVSKTAETTLENTGTTSPSTTTVDPNLVAVNCSIDDNFFITKFSRDDKILNVTEKPNGAVSVLVASFPADYVLIWYENKFPRQIHMKTVPLDLIQCIGKNFEYDQPEEIPVPKIPREIHINTKLDDGKTYIFCMAQERLLLISPLNCISYQKTVEVDKNSWFAEEKRVQLIMAIIAVYIFTVFVGILCLHFIIRKIKAFQKRQMVTVVHGPHP